MQKKECQILHVQSTENVQSMQCQDIFAHKHFCSLALMFSGALIVFVFVSFILTFQKLKKSKLFWTHFSLCAVYSISLM